MYPRVKTHVLRAHNQEHTFFVYLHANGNPPCVIHEQTVHEGASLGTLYKPTSMSNMQVTRVHTIKKGDTQVHSPLSNGALWYLCVHNHRSFGLSTRNGYYLAFHWPVCYF